MTRKTRPYPKEFRAEAVRLVLEQGLSLREVSQRLAVAKGTLAGWVANARGANAQRAPGARSVAELENEVSGLRLEPSRTRMERDILKKAASYFAKESLTARVHKDLARPISGACDGTGPGGTQGRVLRMVEAAALTDVAANQAQSR